MIATVNEMELCVQLAPPPIKDDSGVQLTVNHADFLALTPQAIADWRARRAPLGMSPNQYSDFRKDFFLAAAADSLTTHQLDVRIKGSSAVFFSGIHKSMPKNLPEIIKAFSVAYASNPKAPGPIPTHAQLNNLIQLFEEFSWHQPFPRRRPFDALYKLGIDPTPSDYDIQISSQQIYDSCHTYASINPAFPLPPNPSSLLDKYGSIHFPLVSHVIGNIFAWADKQSIALKRPVNVKVFPGSGPPNVTPSYKELSSHFRAHDWILIP